MFFDGEEDEKNKVLGFNFENFELETTDRVHHPIPSGVKEAYVLISHGTDDTSLDFSVSGAIINAQERIANVTEVDNYGIYHRATIEVYKVNLSGQEGTIEINSSGR